METVNFVKDNKIDIVFHSGSQILRQPILEAPKLAVVGYHHGDIKKYRGPFQGFWELYYGETKAGVTIQSLKPELDTGAILVLENYPISKDMKLKDVQKMLNWSSVHLGAIGIERLIDRSDKIEYNYRLGEYRSFPNLFDIFWLIIKRRI
jgi:methionyl-tRNA formyltransferase